MEVVVLPYALMVGYGALVLGCGAVAGFIAGRNAKRLGGGSEADPDDPLEARIEARLGAVEQELELARRQVDDLVAERDFMRELKRPRSLLRSA